MHYGTGLYGPKKRRIKAKNKQALKTPYGIFKSVAGAKAQPYLQEALDDYIRSGQLNKLLDKEAKAMMKDLTVKLDDTL